MLIMLFMQSHRFCLQEQRLQGSGVLEQRLQDSGVLEAGREAACDPAVITRGPTRPNDSRQTHVEQARPSTLPHFVMTMVMTQSHLRTINGHRHAWS